MEEREGELGRAAEVEELNEEIPSEGDAAVGEELEQ